ncbi:tail protein X [Rhodomicrobium sp.]|jgi:phage tail protein X|uniref:tail protein X n=1 Tax=Rhodomicrobium sp. TaxID=2720632 RepID=UPI0039E3015B
MADTYLTKDGDMIDEICWRYYEKGQQALAVERVYEANRRLAMLGPKLPAGTLVILPDLPRPAATPIIRIWG